MAIAYDAQSSSTLFNSSATSRTWSHTCTGSDRLLLLGFSIFRSTSPDIVTGATYNGVSMTKIGNTQLPQSNIATYLFALANPATGTNNITVSWTPATTYAWGAALSFTGVDQTTPVTSITESIYSATTSFSDDITIGSSSSWIAGHGFNNVSTRYDSVSSPMVMRAANATDPRTRMFDSNGTVSAGSNNVTITMSSVDTGATHWVEIQAAGAAPSYRFVPQLNPFAGL